MCDIFKCGVLTSFFSFRWQPTYSCPLGNFSCFLLSADFLRGYLGKQWKLRWNFIISGISSVRHCLLRLKCAKGQKCTIMLEFCPNCTMNCHTFIVSIKIEEGISTHVFTSQMTYSDVEYGELWGVSINREYYRWMSFDIKFTRQGFENACWHREACRAIQQAFSKLSLVNLISKDKNLVFYLSVYQLFHSSD